MENPKKAQLAGYAYLVDKFRLDPIPNWHRSVIGSSARIQIDTLTGYTEETYPQQYWPGEEVGDHLEFALKYDGVNLGILGAIFDAARSEELARWIASKSTGKYARKIWYLYEFIVGKELPLPNLAQGNYIDLLEPERYYTVSPGRRIQRQRVIDNLLGGKRFCPVIRKTDAMTKNENVDLLQRCEEITSRYPSELILRATHFLYNKETKSSFAIESVEPDAHRAGKFAALLQLAERDDYCEKSKLIDLQNRIVDARFADSDYREHQNYIGETIAFQQQFVHFVSPRPEDIADLMDGLLESHSRMKEGDVPPVVHAAAIAYGFVFLHPFEDGNGRIHRFLIHNILSIRGAVPEGLMFPVSAAMLKDRRGYDASLEAFSKPLLQRIEYHLDDEGRMTVEGTTGCFYRFVDMTAQAEALYDFVINTIENELASELDFLARYDRAKQAVQGIVDMPDRLVELFIHVCLQNKGRVSANKRKSQFDMLTDNEVQAMENAIIQAYERELSP